MSNLASSAGRPSGQVPTRITHGRHCTCSACAREDWTNPDLAPCGMHGADCPALYQPWGLAGTPLAAQSSEPLGAPEDVAQVAKIKSLARQVCNIPFLARVQHPAVIRLMRELDRHDAIAHTPGMANTDTRKGTN